MLSHAQIHTLIHALIHTLIHAAQKPAALNGDMDMYGDSEDDINKLLEDDGEDDASFSF